MATLRQTPNQTWRVRWYAPPGCPQSRTFKTKTEAQTWMTHIEKQPVRRVRDMTGKTWWNELQTQQTLEEYAITWASQQNHRPSTQEIVRSALQYLHDSEIGAAPLTEIRLHHGTELQKYLQKRGLSNGRIRLTHTITKAILRAATHENLIPNNPWENLATIPRQRKTPIPPSWEVIKQIAHAAGKNGKALIMFAATTGLRQSEVFGITRDRLDLENGWVRVDRQLVTYGNNPPIFMPPKTPSSIRNVPLNTYTIQILQEHLETPNTHPARNALTQHNTTNPNETTSELIFLNSIGAPWRRGSWGNVWRKARQTVAANTANPANIHQIRFHDLRHFYASSLIRYGASVKTVQHTLGHASAIQTLDTYAHLWDDAETQIRNAITTAVKP